MTKPEIFDWLRNHEGQVDAPLILAARQGQIDVLDYLLQCGTDLNVVDQYGNNALWAACFSESATCIEHLIQAGIDLNVQNHNGNSVLMYAASSGKSAVVERLLNAGADPRLTNPDDFSAVDLAANRLCLQLLWRRLKDLDKQ
jgi:uncharacterized protein